MQNVIGKSWRDSASLIVLTKCNGESLTRANRGGVNYDILLQTRTSGASFANSVVFPGGVHEPGDGGERWLQLLASFGYTKEDFATLHHPNSTVTQLFQNNPIQRHIELRITAIRETFEELGLLICSKDRKSDKKGVWADVVTDIDIKHWQKRVSKNPDELLNLCKEYNCYPDIWSLHYWSNWLTPVNLPKRFDAAFFVTAVQDRPAVESNSEVANVEWRAPEEILSSTDRVVFPPQVYELTRLAQVKDLEQLVRFAAERSRHGTELLYPYIYDLKDGHVHLLPGDDLYPSTVDLNDNTVKFIDKTILQLREGCSTLHRLEINKETNKRQFISQNYKPRHHIDMGDRIILLQMS